MLTNHHEYRTMYEAEESLWWYRVLHEKVHLAIVEKFDKNKNIKILDAGCGTGGMMNFLIERGYENIEGFDFSTDAVSFCKLRNLNVEQIDITNFDKNFINQNYDVIINNDVVYQFDNKMIESIFSVFQQKLKIDGILITNNNSFDIFYGTHDIAVGGKQRFVLNDFQKITSHLPLQITHHSYWSWILSPLILMVRLVQQLGIKFKIIDLKNVKSDVSVPLFPINRLLYNLAKFEEKVFRSGFFGSSLFMVLQNGK